MTRTLKPLILNTGALALTLILIYTGISAHDKLTWLMEVTPVIIVVPLLLDAPRDKRTYFREINYIAAAFQYQKKNYKSA